MPAFYAEGRLVGFLAGLCSVLTKLFAPETAEGNADTLSRGDRTDLVKGYSVSTTSSFLHPTLRKFVLCAAIVVLVCLAIEFLLSASVPGAFFRVPAEHDRRLLGSWIGSSSRGKREVSFFPDGTYRIEGLWPIKWGTRNGLFYAKCRSAGEGWDCAVASYRMAADGQSAVFSGKPTFMVPSTIIRKK